MTHFTYIQGLNTHLTREQICLNNALIIEEMCLLHLLTNYTRDLIKSIRIFVMITRVHIRLYHPRSLLLFRSGIGREVCRVFLSHYTTVLATVTMACATLFTQGHHSPGPVNTIFPIIRLRPSLADQEINSINRNCIIFFLLFLSSFCLLHFIFITFFSLFPHMFPIGPISQYCHLPHPKSYSRIPLSSKSHFLLLTQIKTKQSNTFTSIPIFESKFCFFFKSHASKHRER